MKINQLATQPVGRLLWEYSLPAVAGMVVVSLYNIIDRVIIGQQVGPAAIAALAICFPVMNLATALGILVGAGSAARVSILLGQKRLDDATRVLGNALTLTFIIGIIYISCFAIFLDDILRAFGATPEILPYAHDFMSTLLPGLLLMNLTYGFNNIQRASGYPRRAMMAMLLSAGVNLVFALLFVIVFGWGIRGAAAATVVAMFSAMCFVLWHFTQKSSTIHFRKGIYRLDWHIVLSIVSIGCAPSLINAAGCLVNVIINKSLVEYGGDNVVAAVAAAGIFTTVTQFVCMVVVGICQGMQPIVGYNYGAGLMDRMRKAFLLATVASTVLCTAGSVVGLSIPGLLARAFTSDPGLIANTEVCLRSAMWAFCVVGFQIVATTFFQSIGKAGKAIVLSLSRQVIFLVPLLLLLPRVFSLQGVWLSFPISDLLATAVTVVLVIWQFRQLASSRHSGSENL